MRHLFKRSQETALLVNYFKQLSFDKPVSFADIGKAVGFKVTSSTPAYHSARTIAARDHAIVIEGIRGFGFQRLTGEKIADTAPRDFRSIRRRARRSALKQEIAVQSNLEADKAATATAQLSRFRLLADMATPPSSNRKDSHEPPAAAKVDTRAQLLAVK